MNLSELRASLSNHLQLDLDNLEGSSPTDAQLTTQINLAKREFESYTFCCYGHKIPFTLRTGFEEYNLRDRAVFSKMILHPKYVTLNGTTLKGPDGELGLWNITDNHELYRGYQTYDNGTPVRAFLDGERIIFSPPPDATAVAGTNYISGAYLTDDFKPGVDDKKSLDIPSEYEKSVVYLAAAYASVPLISEEEAWARYREFRSLAENGPFGMNAARKKYRARILGPRPIRGSRADWVRDSFSV